MTFSEKRAYSDKSDAELCALAASGDTTAEELLVIRYTPMVYAFTRNFYRDGWERADFVQEGMFGLIRAIREYDPSGGVPFSSFAAVCVKNELNGALRKALRSKHAPLTGYLSLSDSAAALGELFALKGTGFDNAIADADEAARLISRLDELLSPFERKIFRAWMDGYEPSEIAGALGKPVRSVENAITRILGKAKRLSANQA
jgi:RNA polymerase sporulation-specific sigma factor